MSKDISLLGAVYYGVPAVQLPQNGGGTATFYDASGSQTVTSNGTYDVTALAEMVVNVAGGCGTDFVITIAWDEDEEKWIPDKTFSEIYNAYQDGLTIGMYCPDAPAYGWYSDEGSIDDDFLEYAVDEFNDDEKASHYYEFSNNGIYDAGTSTFYDTAIHSTASASEVANGAVFYNASGKQTGTATRRTSSDLTASGAMVTAPAGYYASSASKAVASGTAGTPTASKGAVNNNSINVTPSVTNTTGYIAGSTITGTAVSVSASELVSGSQTVTDNGTYDVTNLASVTVNVSGGGSRNVQVAAGVNRVNTTEYTAVSGQSLTVAKTGTYDVYWTGYRSTTSGTSGSQLYIGSTAYGSAQTSFSNNAQSVHLSSVSLTQNQTVTVRARARSTNYYMYVGNLTIVQSS